MDAGELTANNEVEEKKKKKTRDSNRPHVRPVFVGRKESISFSDLDKPVFL